MQTKSKNPSLSGDSSVYCPTCGHYHFGHGIGICKAYANMQTKLKKSSLFADAPSVYCPSCGHDHFGQGLGICKAYSNCPCELKYSEQPEMFTSDKSSNPVPTFTATLTPEAIPAPTPPGLNKASLFSHFKDQKHHEFDDPTAEELQWLEINAPGIIDGSVSCHAWWVNFFKNIWCGRNSWTHEEKNWADPEAFDKWLYKIKYIDEYFANLKLFLTERGYDKVMSTAIIVRSGWRPRTQKAKGLVGLARFNSLLQSKIRYQFPVRTFALCKVERVLEEDNLKELAAQLLDAWRVITRNGELKLFARPCPHRPRHGFVDSRVLELPLPENGWTDIHRAVHAFNSSNAGKLDPENIPMLEAFVKPLRELAEEVREHDKRGEIILMPFVEAAMGAIYANGAITVGLGHEGATSGENTSIFPCANVWPEGMDAAFWEKSGIEGSPFLEIVYEAYKTLNEDEDGQVTQTVDPIKANPVLVQLRDGPKMELESCGADYIPSVVELQPKNVLTIGQFASEKNALIAFENAIEKAKPGTVVLHPGGAISSHYGIHCVINKIPYITSKELCKWIDMWRNSKLGSCSIFPTDATFILQPTGEISTHNGTPDRAKWLEGFNAGLAMEAIPYADAMIQASLYFLHSASAINFGDPTIAYAFGFCLAQSLKLGMLAIVGEARHRQVKLGERVATAREEQTAARETIYEIGDSIPAELLAMHSMEIAKAFEFKGWGSGVGGHNWHLCGIAVARTWNACVDFIEGGDFTPVIAGFNNVIHASHNGAKMLTKFSTIATMDLAVKCPPVMALITAPILWYLTHNQSHDVRRIDIRRCASAKEVEAAQITLDTHRAFASLSMEEL